MWIREIIHKSYMTTDDLIGEMKTLDVDEEQPMYGDSAEPKTIESIRRAGYNITLSNKEVKAGIDCVKSYKMYIHSSSIKLQEELRRYKWKMQGEIKTDEPIRLFDDGLCAVRYAVFTWTQKTKRFEDNDIDISFLDY
jgi:phage terminase large subunit